MNPDRHDQAPAGEPQDDVGSITWKAPASTYLPISVFRGYPCSTILSAIPSAPAEWEPELIPDSLDLAAKESKSDKALLKNPCWVTETVGFNEEADISVEAVLPESQAHKTRVIFELFALTPAGAERISKAEGHVSKGKAVARIPV